MNCEIVKLDAYSGSGASIYTIYIEEEETTLYEKFVSENKSSYNNEVKDINNRLITIGKIGAREQFFKLKEGAPSDGVCALFDNPNSNIRLYCIRYGSNLIIVGGGGPKSKSIRSLQQDDKLTKENYILRAISKEITQKMNDRELKFTTDYFDFEGDTNLNLNHDE